MECAPESSLDGLAPAHDKRRSPATYARILDTTAGQRVIVHCTITGPMLGRSDYLGDFARFWSRRDEVRKIWFSLYTPQEGDNSPERLRPQDRVAALQELAEVRRTFPKIHLPEIALKGYYAPPNSPEECIYADHELYLRGSNHSHRALPIRRPPCLLGVWLHGFGRPCRHWQVQTRRRPSSFHYLRVLKKSGRTAPPTPARSRRHHPSRIKLNLRRRTTRYAPTCPPESFGVCVVNDANSGWCVLARRRSRSNDKIRGGLL